MRTTMNAPRPSFDARPNISIRASRKPGKRSTVAIERWIRYGPRLNVLLRSSRSTQPLLTREARVAAHDALWSPSASAICDMRKDSRDDFDRNSRIALARSTAGTRVLTGGELSYRSLT